ncbi:A disintegrin and metalloproteinase with thrombospondin motifs 20 [Tupaia chinensis]|uniref:A disintegrin and metalloproteinase with thrombospondin motifs 20 n=1 Tax=Tupaia chinensis TaxID=246437 RepID=L8Y352_TUPCH|nr:A disintegrin and metalloproteinase with thrombospondin motifs 20 [Tupaia chinensis]
MRVAKWLTGLLYQLSLFITRSWEVRFHPRQEALVKTLASYEVVTPARVNEFGEVFPQSRHFSRKKRSSEALEPTPFRTHYRISAYGQLFQLNLSADAAFLAAGYTEVHLGAPAHGARERSMETPDLRHCFYRGQVNAQENYTAVFSLCGGLMGTFKAHDGEYFLEPIMKADGSEHEDDHNKPHLIYRLELKKSSYLQSHKPCEVSENQIKKMALPFHNHSDMNEDLNVKKEIVLGYPSKNVTREDERSQLHSRNKRFISYPRYVEVMVTADAKMVHYHGQNLQHYILTLMSIVSLAELGTLCDPLRSCSISEENGLSAAFTIAHELGHVFNAPHDDSFKCKESGMKHQYHVMAPTLNYHSNPWTWSKCSQKYITEFLEPRNGGKYCVGRRMKFRSCNTDSCPKGKQDFREKQCSDFDGKHFNINGLSPNVRWLPKYSGIAMKDRCKLYCRVAGTTNFYQLKDRVADGTPCGTETNDICVQGLCRQAGCDHVLNSKARRDKCGVCGGDNSSCRTMAGVFNSAHYGYNVIVKIPTGATNIEILQHSYSGKPEDDNYLALSDARGNFLLNGNFVVSMSKKEINVQGVIFEYSGSNNSVERINSTDRLEEELILQCLVTCGKGTKQRQVWCQLNEDHLSEGFCNPSTKPESLGPCELLPCASWQVGPWGSCTATCGHGYQMRAVKCVSEVFSAVLDDRDCHGLSRPNDRQCSSSCAAGVQRRVVVCQDENGHSASYCAAASKPPESKHCDSGPCPQWNYGNWGECTQTCGGGIKSRFVICQFPNGQISQEDNCEVLKKPPSMVQCHMHACPDAASWHRGPWKSVR